MAGCWRPMVSLKSTVVRWRLRTPSARRWAQTRSRSLSTEGAARQQLVVKRPTVLPSRASGGARVCENNVGREGAWGLGHARTGEDAQARENEQLVDAGAEYRSMDLRHRDGMLITLTDRISGVWRRGRKAFLATLARREPSSTRGFNSVMGR